MDDPRYGKALDNEALGWGGDSGGPAFITRNGETKIVGVNSGGGCCDYGSVD